MQEGVNPISAFSHEETARKIARQLTPASVYSYEAFYGAAIAILFEFDRAKRPISEEQLIRVLKACQDMSVCQGRRLTVYPLLEVIL